MNEAVAPWYYLTLGDEGLVQEHTGTLQDEGCGCPKEAPGGA